MTIQLVYTATTETFNFTLVEQDFNISSSGFCERETRTWFDVDNNGFIDVVFSGLDVDGDFVTDTGVWPNEGGVFGGLESRGDGGGTCEDFVPGEYNGDGKIDLFFAGFENVAFKSASVGLLTNTGSEFSRGDWY